MSDSSTSIFDHGFTSVDDMAKVKVHLYLKDGRSFWGYFFKQPNDRLQDLLNDQRNFIPFARLYEDRGTDSEDHYRTIMVQKDAISTVEER